MSRLAKAQAQLVGQTLARRHPNIRIEYCWIESEGDVQRDVALTEAGGKGLFARAIEQALLQERADVAVHSLKDLPVPDTQGLHLIAIPARHDVRDCLIVPPGGAATLHELQPGATLGTASPRRSAQVKMVRPDLRIELMRGNIDTRLRKVIDERRYDATLLAAAGLHRAGMSDHALRIVEPETILPAACQGALALQCRQGDHVTLSRCLPLNDPVTAAAVHLERTIVAGLHGDCRSPIAVLAQPQQRDSVDGYRLRVRALHPQGKTSVDADDWAPAAQAGQLGKRVLADLLARGAAEIIRCA